MANENTLAPIKTSLKFNCIVCDFNCSKQSDFSRHLITAKHLNANKANANDATPKHVCSVCDHIFKHASSLSRHKKKCIVLSELAPDIAPDIAHDIAPVYDFESDSDCEPVKKPKLYEKDNMIELLISENKDFKNIILELVKNNGDLQKQMMEVCSKGSNSMTNSHNHSHNKTFNMQFFLNEKCKDAMNIKDFVNSMTLELEDLEEVGKLGYVEGISNIMIRKLNALDVYNRPIHCSDAKREIMFVKDDNIWEKENCTYDKLRKAIKSVTYKNSALLGPWSEKYPNCLNNQHHLNDIYVQMLGQAMGGKESFLDSENKIMKKIAKAVLIEKK
jgi:hypothetical protein